eukprot:6203006-Pleurochrysis_carterae.AAC.1
MIPVLKHTRTLTVLEPCRCHRIGCLPTRVQLRVHSPFLWQLLKNIESSSAQLPPQLTQPCQRLLSSLLQREPTERLSFEAFFADPFLDLSSPKSRSSSGAAQPTVEHGARLSSDQERGELRGEGVEPRAHATAEAVAAACKASASSATAPPHHPAAAAAPAAAH